MDPTFTHLNMLTGWSLFMLTTGIYAFAVEPTASFWDCGEFIAAAYKLEVPHPSGAPLFLLLGRLFSLLAADTSNIALLINGVSVLSSSFTILFLYWSIVLLTRKLAHIIPGTETPLQQLQLMGSGVVGALAFAFSDSFWFSAEEAEVYALSTFFVALIFWAALTWETIEDPQQANKWLILIAYLIGLSIGAHLLNLLCLPAMALLWYYKKYTTPSLRGSLLALLFGFALVGIIMAGIVTGIPSLASWFEIKLVNGLGLPFGWGALLFAFASTGALLWGIYITHRMGRVVANVALLCLSFILIGYSSYVVVLVRSGFNPPIDQNDPENLLSFVYYLKREQYGERPLLWGNYFDAEISGYEKGDAVYRKGETEYEVAYHKTTYRYAEDQNVLLPRIYSPDPAHQQLYREALGLLPHEKPSFKHNLMFLFRYQLGHMYWRYFLWNFAGRESDERDAGWLTPFDAFEQDVPYLLQINKARNNFFMLPLLLGLLGAFYQYRRSKQGFVIVLTLFISMGVALILYLNSPPIEPRERDYIYVGSFYAFAMWIGIGLYAMANYLLAAFKQQASLVAAVALALGLVIPLIMFAEGWDDHDRSKRFFAADSARNMLLSCAPNAILFTGGDNDTYPLWYAQEVEGIRTDVRVVVLPYLNAEWFIRQLTEQKNDSAPLPIRLTMDHYREGGLNDIIYHVENKSVKGPLPLDQYIALVKENHPAIRYSQQSEEFNTIPSNTIGLPIDREVLRSEGIVSKEKESLLVDKMVFKLKKGVLYKADLFLLDLISSNQWERPIYFNNTSLQSIGLDLTDWIVHEGTAYRLLPLKNPSPDSEHVNTALMWRNMMQQFQFRELDNPEVYYSEEHTRLIQNHRASFNTLAKALIAEGAQEKAREMLLRSLTVMPDAAVPYDVASAMSAELMLQARLETEALQLADTVAGRSDEMLEWQARGHDLAPSTLQLHLFILNHLSRSLAAAGFEKEAQRYHQLLAKHYQRLQHRM